MEEVFVADSVGVDEDDLPIEFMGWQYQIDFLKEDDGSGNAFDEAKALALESGQIRPIVPCGAGVMRFLVDSKANVVPECYMEEDLNSFEGLWLFVDPGYRKVFSRYDLDNLMDAMSDLGITSIYEEDYPFSAREAVCEATRTSLLQ